MAAISKPDYSHVNVDIPTPIAADDLADILGFLVEVGGDTTGAEIITGRIRVQVRVSDLAEAARMVAALPTEEDIA